VTYILTNAYSLSQAGGSTARPSCHGLPAHSAICPTACVTRAVARFDRFEMLPNVQAWTMPLKAQNPTASGARCVRRLHIFCNAAFRVRNRQGCNQNDFHKQSERGTFPYFHVCFQLLQSYGLAYHQSHKPKYLMLDDISCYLLSSTCPPNGRFSRFAG